MDKRKINEWKWKVTCLTLQLKAPIFFELPGRTADLGLLVARYPTFQNMATVVTGLSRISQ
jgi:hypothetical protein